MNTRHSKAYEQLAATAAAQADLPERTAEAAAGDDGARQIRDSLWEQYERMLRDTQTWRLEQIGEWLTERGATASRASIHRDRRALLERERVIFLAAARAREILKAASDTGEHDVLRAGRVVAGQMLLSALTNLSSAALEGLRPHQVLRMIDSLGALSKAHAETDLIRQKLTELQRRFDEQISAAQAAAPDGRLTPEQIAEAKEAIFGKVA